MIKKIFFIFVIMLFFSLNVYARPDLKIGTIGDNTYGTFGKGGGGETTLYNTVPGKYNKISLTIENDTDNTSIKDQIYPVSFSLPSDKWDYYILYKNEKYTGTWATDIIKDNSSLDFDVYIKPPDSAGAVTYPLIISAIENNNLADSFIVNVNVIQQANFDIMLIFDNGTTIGDYQYNSSLSSYKLFVDKYDRYNLNFKVINRGNILGAYTIKLSTSQISSSAVKLYNDNSDITNASFNGKEFFLDNASYNTFQLKIDGNKVNSSGEVYLNIYNESNQLIDSFTVNVSLINSSTNIYKFPYFNYYDNITVLIISNFSSSQGSVTFKNLVDNKITTYNLNANGMSITKIANKSRVILSSDNIVFAPYILIFDKHYNIIASHIPYNINLTGTDMAVPLITNYDNYSSAQLFISNDSGYKNMVNIAFYSYKGDEVYKKIFYIEKDNSSIINIPSLISNDNSSIYWAEIKSSNPVSGFLINTFFNSFFKIKCFEIRK